MQEGCRCIGGLFVVWRHDEKWGVGRHAVLASPKNTEPKYIEYMVFLLRQMFKTEASTTTLLVIAPLMIGFLPFQRQFMNSFIHSGIK